MNEPADTPRTTSLLLQLLGLLSRHTVQWLAVLRRDYLLIAFLLLSFVCLNAMVVLNVLRHPFVPWRALPVFLPTVWVFFYGGIFLAMVFAAHTSPDRVEPMARRPRAELIALLTYLGLMFLAVYLRAHGNGHSLPGRALGGLIAALDRVDGQALDGLGVAVSDRCQTKKSSPVSQGTRGPTPGGSTNVQPTASQARLHRLRRLRHRVPLPEHPLGAADRSRRCVRH